MTTKLRRQAQVRRAGLRRWLSNSTPTRWVRWFVCLLGVLLLIISGAAVQILRIQANEVNQLTQVVAPAVEANDQVLHAMTDADSGLLGYQISHDLRLLTAYRDARMRTSAALATLQYKLVLWNDRNDDDHALDVDLEVRQHLAVQQWWSYALSTEQAVTQGDTVDMLQGDALFNSFRLANAAINEHLKTERDQAQNVARANSAARTKQIIVVALAAFVAILVLGERSARVAETNLIAQRRAEDMSARMAWVVELGSVFGRVTDLNEVLTRIVEAARTVLGARYAAIGMLDTTGTGLTEFVTAGLSPDEISAIGELPQRIGLLGAIIRDQKVLRLEHLADDPRSVGFPPHHPRMDSFLGVSIVIHGEVFGNLYLTDKTGGPFTAEDEQVVRSFALYAAAAVENVRRYEAERQRANMLERAREIEYAIRTMTNTQQALDVLCIMLGEELGVDRVMANTVDAEHAVLLGSQWHKPSLGDVSDDLILDVGHLAEKLWQSGEHIVLHYSHPSQVVSTQDREFHREIGAEAVIVVPIGLGERVLGVIYVVTVRQPRRWTEAEVGHVQQVAAFMAQFIVEAEHRAYQREHIERLERFERQQTNFVTTVSHELRTPLTSITGYLELLKDGYAGKVTEDQQQMLEVMDRNTVRLRKLIENLLVLNQSEHDSHKADIVGVSVRELITTACLELSPFAQSRAIELKIDTSPDGATIQGDKEQLQSAVVNVVSNAIKFSRPEGVVTLSCTLNEGARRIRFTCQDRGIGIPVVDQEGLFTKFFRASNAIDQQIPGTGLGLTIVKQIIEDHGGQVQLTSVEGEGTTVVIDLPLSLRASS